MISRIILGDATPDEVSVSGDRHPAVVRAQVRALHCDPAQVVVATWSPVAIDEVLHLWRCACKPGEEYDRILLRGQTGDPRLSQVRDASWLAHFSIGDLLLHGEFDEWLVVPEIDPEARA
jgi:hypothetical protein